MLLKEKTPMSVLCLVVGSGLFAMSVLCLVVGSGLFAMSVLCLVVGSGLFAMSVPVSYTHLRAHET